MPGLGSISRIFGLMLIAVALLYILLKKNIKEPSLLVVLFGVFVIWGILSFFWGANPSRSISRFITNLQLLAMIWLIWELCDSKEDFLRLMQAFVLGLFVSIYDMLSVYLSFDYGYDRITAGEFNANQIAIYLALGIPFAWYMLLQNRRTIFYWFNAVYLPLAAFCLILTGSRTGMIVGLVGLSIIPFTFFRLNVTGKKTILALFAGILIFMTFNYQQIMPNIEHNIERLIETQQQIEGGHISGRGSIWRAGVRVFTENPIMGVGSGSFGISIIEYHGRHMSAHNTYLAVLVEGGMIGFIIFLFVLLVVFIPVLYIDPLDRIFYAILFATILIAMLPLHLEADKVLWTVLAFFQANAFIIIKNGGFRVVHRQIESS